MFDFYQFNILDVSILLLYFIGIIFLHNKFSPKHNNLRKVSILMALTHLLMSVAFYFFLKNSEGDAKGYFKTVFLYNSWTDTTLLNGSGFVEFCLYPFVKFMGLSFFSANMIFSFVSLIGFYKIFNVFCNFSKNLWTNWFYVFLLPSMHFWTGAIGKDALIFYAISSLFYNILKKKGIVYYLLPFLIIALVRFYIFTFIGLGVAIALIFLNKNIKISTKIFFTAAVAAISTILLPYFFKTIAVDGFSGIEKQKDFVSRANMSGGGSLDLSDSNLIVKWFSYIFRPFIFEARNAQMVLSAVENLVWIVMFYFIFLGIKRKSIPNARKSLYWISFVCIFTLTLPSAYILSNLGIAARQKIMIVPFLLFLFLVTVSSPKFRFRKN